MKFVTLAGAVAAVSLASPALAQDDSTAGGKFIAGAIVGLDSVETEFDGIYESEEDVVLGLTVGYDYETTSGIVFGIEAEYTDSSVGVSATDFDVPGDRVSVNAGRDIISMSLGRATGPQEPLDPLYEDITAEALEAGCLIVAAAGNDSDRRYRYVAPVSSPANAPSIMAVAAIEADGRVAPYSNGGVGTGRIDVAAPGSGVFSSVPRPQLYRILSGTSMACPHVAGLAALWAESNPALRGQRLWDQLVAAAEPLEGQSTIDIGKGLVKAP